MPIDYSLAERFNPADPAAPRKVYAVARSCGEATVRDLAEHISRTSTLSTVDVVAALEAFFQLVPERLAAGYLVRFGDFGSFSVSLQGEGAASAEEFTAGLIHHVKVGFRPGALFAQAMQRAELRRTNAPLAESVARAARRKSR